MQTFVNHLIASVVWVVLSGPATVCGQVSISGVVNQYASVQAISGNNRLTVDDPSVFTMSGRVLVIQMQGATIDESNNPTFGSITDTGSAGLYEYNSVCGINGDTLVLEYELAHTYSVPGKVQVVQVPQYPEATVTGSLTALPWNDSTGGIIAIDVSGTLTLSGNIDATGMGFKGGEYTPAPPTCNWYTSYPNYYYVAGSENGLSKGQGVASIIVSKEHGRGAQANGGGGGNNHNAGGGGGANAGGGGKGGDNNEPGSFNCKGFNPGLGGKPLRVTPMRFYFGGGGGSGHGNNTDPGSISSGGAGGGIVFIRADSIIGNGYAISAAGAAGGYASNDGAGGGGAGGTVILDVGNYHGSGLTIDVSGGDGGDADNDGQPRCFGPGGGGGGGVVFTRILLPPYIAVDTSGGANGETINSTSCTGPLNAEDGEAGSTFQGISVTGSGVPATGCATLLPVEGFDPWIEQFGNEHVLKWRMINPMHVEQFVVEYQDEFGARKEIGKVRAQAKWDAEYQFALPRLPAGKYYLRLGAVSGEQPADYSRWISWFIRDHDTECRLLPNVVNSDEPTMIHLNQFNPGKVSMEVFNAKGQRIQLHSNLSETESIKAPAPGVYYVRISDGVKACQARFIVSP